jgi:hypothetical protein
MKRLKNSSEKRSFKKMLCEYPFDILKGESTSLKITILSSRNVKMKNKGGDGES